MKIKNAFAIFISALILVSSGFLGGYQYCTDRKASAEYSLLRQARRLIEDHYIYDLPDSTSLERGMAHGMVQRINDPYTIYVEPAEHELQEDELEGEFGGIGAYVAKDEAGNVRLYPYANGPADNAGIIDGDVLLYVDSIKITQEMSMNTIVALLRGPTGITIRISIARFGHDDERHNVMIKREAIPLPSTKAYIIPDALDVGVIIVTFFSEKTAGEVEEAYQALLSKGAASLILDLRGNSGGLLNSAISVADFFLEKGVISIERSRDQEETIYKAQNSREAADITLAVLVDEGTASAAEVVAAALQSNKRAPLIGTPTYGKGSIQGIYTLKDGSSLHITEAEWLTPDRISLNESGLQPDIIVERNDDQTDNVLSTAIIWIHENQTR